MLTTFADFAEAVKKNRDKFVAIPKEYLNEDGKAMKELFVQLDFDLNFADSAADMLQLIRTGSRYSEIDNAEAIRKLSVIERSLEEIENR